MSDPLETPLAQPDLSQAPEVAELESDRAFLTAKSPSIDSTEEDRAFLNGKTPDANIPIGLDLPQSLADTAFPQAVVNELGTQGLDKAVEASHGDIEWALRTYNHLSVDQASKVKRIARAGKIPFSLVDSDPKTFAEWDEANGIAETLMAKDEKGAFKNPVAMRWLRDPENMSIHKDSILGLQKIEDTIRDRKNGDIGRTESFINSLGQGAVTSLASLPKYIATTAKALDMFGEYGGRDATDLASYQFGRWLEETGKDIFPTNPEYSKEFWSGQVPSGIGQLGGMVVGGGAGGAMKFAPWATSLFMAVAGESANAYDQAKDEGATEDQALDTSRLTAPVGLLDSIVPGHMLGRLLKGVGGKATKLLLNTAFEVATEAGTETAQSVLENTVAKKVYNEDKAYWDGALESGGVGGISALVASLVISAATGQRVHPKTGSQNEAQSSTVPANTEQSAGEKHLADLVNQGLAKGQEKYETIQVSEKAITDLDNLKATAEGLASANRDPDGVANFIDETLKHHGESTEVAVDAKAVAQVFFQDAKTPEQQAQAQTNFDAFVTEMGGTPSKASEAVLNGADILLNTGQFIAKYRNHPVYEAVREDMKNGTDLAKQDLERHIQDFQEEAKKFQKQAELPETLKLARTRLMTDKETGGLGFSAKEADSQIAIWHKMLEVTARDRGTTVEALLKAQPLQVLVGADGKTFVEALAKQSPSPGVADSVIKAKIEAAVAKGGPVSVAIVDRLGVELPDNYLNYGAFYAPVKASNETLSTDDMLALEKEARAFDEEMLASSMDQHEELLDAIKALGGILTPSMEAKASDMKGEVQRIREAYGKRPGLFRKNALTLDKLAEALRERGFHFEGPTDLAEALYNRVNQGIEVFNGSAEETRFQPSSSEQSVDDGYAKLAQEAIIGNRSFTTPIPLGGTPAVLRALGFKALPVTIDQDTLIKASGPLHRISVEDLKRLPQQIRDPILVFESSKTASHPGYNILTEFKHPTGKSVFAAIHLESRKGKWVINEVATVSERGDGQVQGWLDEELLRYVDEKRATDWLESRGLQLPKERTGDVQLPNKRILTKAEVVKSNGTLFQGASNPRGAIQFTNDTAAAVHLFQTADISTFSHEAVHYRLRQMKSLIESGEASEQILNNWQTILEFAGSTNGELTVEQEEKVATAWEAYLMRGKAPSVELVEPFHNLRKWLLELYKSVKDFMVVPENLSNVFDRMLASETEIKEAREYYATKTDITNLITGDETQRKRLIKSKENLQRSEEERLVQRILNTYFQAIGGEEAITQRIIKEIDAEPFYQALKGAETDKISLGAVRDTYGEDTAAKLAEKYPHLFTEDGLLTIEELAAGHGMSSPADLVHSMMTEPSRTEAIVQRKGEAIKEEEARIRKDVQAESATGADAELHTDKSLAYLLFEAQALANELKMKVAGRSVRLTEKAYRDAARDAIGRMEVGTASQHYNFARAERKWGREVVKHLTSGDKKKAFEARQKQLLNHALVQESIKVREELTKIQARYATRKITAALKNVEDGFRDPIREILSRYKLSDVQNQHPYAIADIEGLDEALFGKVPDFVKNGDKRGDYRKLLTMDELRQVDDAVKSLLAYGSNELASLKAADIQTIEDAVSKLGQTMGTLTDKKTPQKGSWLIPIYKLRELNAKSSLMQFVSNAIDGFSLQAEKKVGLMRKLFQGVVTAEAQKDKRLGEVMEKLAPHMKQLEVAVARIKKQFGKYIPESALGLPLNPEYAKSGDQQWTAEKLLAVMLNTGNDDNLTKLSKGHGWEMSHIEKVAKLFTADELKAIQGVWDTIHSLYPDLAQVHFDIYNTKMGNIEAKPITFLSKDGQHVTLPGGYYPISYDPIIDNKAAAQKEEDALRRAAVLRSKTPQNSMTKGRVAGVVRPIRLDLNVLTSHLDDTVKVITHTKVVRDLNRIIKHPLFKGGVTSKFGNEMYESVTKWVADMANPDPNVAEHHDFMDKIADKLKTIVTYKLLGFNLPLSVAQVSGVVNGFERIGSRWMLQGFKTIGFPGSVDVFLGKGAQFEEIKKLSKVIPLREKSLQKEMNDEFSKLRTDGKSGKLAEFAFWTQQAFDRFHIIPFWSGAFQQHLETLADSSKSHDEQIADAVEYADALLLEVQPSGMKATQSEYQRARTGFYRHFNMFQSFFAMLGNNITSRSRAVYEGKIPKKDLVKYIAAMWLAQVLEQAMKDLLKGKMPTWMDSVLINPLQGFLGWFPVLKEASKTIISKKEGGFRFDLARLVPPALSVPAKGAEKIAGAVTGDKDAGPAIWEASQLVSSAYGLPVQNVAKWLFQLHDNSQDEDTFDGYK